MRLGHISKENVKRKMTEASLIKLTHAQKVFKTPVCKCEIKKKKVWFVLWANWWRHTEFVFLVICLLFGGIVSYLAKQLHNESFYSLNVSSDLKRMVTNSGGIFLCVKFRKVLLSRNQLLSSIRKSVYTDFKKKTNFTAIYWKIMSYKWVILEEESGHDSLCAINISWGQELAKLCLCTERVMITFSGYSGKIWWK